ncbi:histidine kinase [Skermanella stibiiresistens SB22]|uniref:histidine kinase n=1 Tax=Skermanella stibiiresistens SB22 TaxID=1385369 RepID=W9H923_9PROT|nr:ATP-binding protein [Skermanella stibiiresistens]EWY42765.1 histidine kinase [Skermanella stibiiresistens SB22]
METFFQALIVPGDFLPHGLCLTWRPELIWTHLLSDLLIGASYCSIPIGLLYFVWRRQDLAYKWLFLMFCAFILACGVTHFMGAWTLWYPDYVAQGAVKAFTAAISVMTAVVLWPLIPQALALPSPAQLREANGRLHQQILERQRAELEIRRMNDELERRATELSDANRRLRASELHYSSIFHHLAEGLFVVRIDGPDEFRFEALNPSHERQTGLESSEIAGKTPHELFPPDLADHLVERYRACRDARRPIQYEETLDLPAGRRVWQTNLAPVLDSDGNPTKLLGTSRDMTDHRALQEELAQASKLATLGTMAAGIAHEMSQPLNIIKITADDCCLMMEEEGAEADPRYLKDGLDLIGTQASRMGEIVDQMRSFSRRDSPEVVPFDPIQPVRGAVALLERHYGSEGIQLTLDAPATASTVMGRPGRLEQVVVNLLSNAHDAITARRAVDPSFGGGAIHAAVTEDPAAGRLSVIISDDGTGLPPGMAERIFDPFVTTKEASKGLGLGLSICVSLIGAMGGRITAENLDQGARFTISLPTRGQSFPDWPPPGNGDA